MNIHPFTILINYIEAYAMHGGYIFLFLISILEAIPLIGTIIPGHTAVILSGFLAHAGVFNLWAVMFIASLGAIIGDMVGFYLGRKYGESVISRFKDSSFFKEEFIEKARLLIGRHTGKAVIIGRFNPFTRSLMPLLVGASHASSRRFWIYNIIAGISWAVLSALAGYVFGVGYAAVVGYFGKALMIALISAMIFIWGYRFVNTRFHVFRKYELFVLALNILALWGLIETIQDAWAARSSMVAFDTCVNAFMAAYATPFIAAIARVITTIGGTAVTGILGILTGSVLLYGKKWRSGAIMILSTGSTAIFIELMKAFFMRARPGNALQLIVNDPSFPSGHAALAAAFFAIAAYLLAPKIQSSAKRELMIVFCALAAVAIGLSRLILNVHWASDVIAGWSLGVFCATASILLVRYASALIMPKIKA